MYYFMNKKDVWTIDLIANYIQKALLASELENPSLTVF
jgi:hypothetical protein